MFSVHFCHGRDAPSLLWDVEIPLCFTRANAEHNNDYLPDTIEYDDPGDVLSKCQNRSHKRLQFNGAKSTGLDVSTAATMYDGRPYADD